MSSKKADRKIDGIEEKEVVVEKDETSNVHTTRDGMILWDKDGPYEEFGVDSSDSELSDSEVEESDDEDIYKLPRTLLEYSRHTEDREKAKQAAEKAMTVILQLEPKLSVMIRKAKSRNDGKVPPGSKEVKRSYEDMRYLLCTILVENGKNKEINGDFMEAIEKYEEAIICFPRSVQAFFLLSRLKSAFACSTEDVSATEKLLRKAVNLFKTLCSEPEIEQTDSSAEIFGAENEAGSKSVDALSLLLCQQGRFEEASDILRSKGFTHRLSNEVLHYQDNLEPSDTLLLPVTPLTSSATSMTIPAKVVENAVTDKMLQKLEYVFRENGPFWKEHDYDVLLNSSRRAGYFSYLYPIKERNAANAIEQIIDSIYSLVCFQYPEVKTACKYGK